MPRKKATNCRYCDKPFELGDDIYHGAHRLCHNNRPKFVKPDEATRAAKAKDTRRRVIAALARRNGITKEEAEARYNARKSTTCGCGADKTSRALRCPDCAQKAINDRTRDGMRANRKRAGRKQRAKAAKMKSVPVVDKLPPTWDRHVPPKRKDAVAPVDRIINPGVEVTRIPSPWPDWREINPDDLDPAKKRFIESLGRKVC